MLPTDEELKALKESVLLSFVLTIFERDKKAIEQSGVKYPKAYLELIELVEKRFLTDLHAHKQRMRATGLRVIQEKRTELICGWIRRTVGIGMRLFTCGGISEQSMKSRDRRNKHQVRRGSNAV